MSVAQMAQAIGRAAHLSVDASGGQAWRVRCEIVDARTSWGEVQYLVRPKWAGGEPVWVKATRVAFDERTTQW
jgi:hypothetical protein